MHTYFRVFANTWGETLSYRLNFVMWRLRTVLQLLTMFFLWSTLIPANGSLFGYSQSQMLTYILGTSLISSIVIATRTSEIGDQINNGDLSNFLLKPVSYLKYWFARDLGDKGMNLVFSVIEVGILIALFHPPLFLQTNPMLLLLTLAACLISMVMYFFFNYLLGLFGFWSNEIWGPRFIFWIIIGFFAGSLFPLDILPTPVFEVIKFLPFTYLLYFPLKIYLGSLPTQVIFEGIIISLLWTGLLYFTVRLVWNKGLKLYGAEGK
ncbi:MAG: ABC-2 family transporter protein [Candidatus Levybacteria bacterium]|nr:ABC-2 family transporter protein [Candidatus Levybacteria bacterium]